MNLYQIISEQIKKEIAKYLKTVPTTPFTAYTPPEEDTFLTHSRLERLTFGAIFNTFSKRLSYGCMPTKIAKNTIYISDGIAIFDENNIKNIEATTIEVPSYCLHPDTQIYIKENDKVRIMTLGQLRKEGWRNKYILSPTGWKKIKNLWTVRHSCYLEIETRLGEKIICSLNHRFPVSHDNRNKKCDVKYAKDIRTTNNRLDRLLFVPLKDFLDTETTYIENTFLYKGKERIYREKLDYDLGWLIGIIVAEGSFKDCSEGKITIHKKENKIRDKFIKILKEKFNCHYLNKIIDNYQSIQFYSKRLQNLYHKFCKGKCKYKSLNMELILNTPIEFRKGLFDGIMDGDGYKGCFTSASRKLRDDVALLGSSIGKVPSKYKEHSQYDKRTNKIYYSYSVSFIKRSWSKKEYKKQSFRCRTFHIKKVELIEKEIELIDISVEDELFLINNGIVSHNSNDRWVWVYLKPDGTFTANKYAPIVGDNRDYIPICKVWKEHDSDDFDAKTLRDIRPVGFAPFSIFHELRQQFLNLFLGLPKVFLNNITIEPYNQPSLDIKIGSSGDGVLYGRYNPIPDTVLTVPTENLESGEVVDFLVIASAKVDDYDPNDFSWNFKFKKVGENLEEYEIPLAIIKGVSLDTTEITSDMIETLGLQVKKEDFYDYELEFNYSKINRDWLVRRRFTSNNTNTDKEIILGVDTSEPRTIYLSDEDLKEGRIIIIKDETGNAETNNITVEPETSGVLIDGEESKVINTNYGVLRLYSDGNNWFTF